MAPILNAFGRFRAIPRVLGYIFLFLAIGFSAACQPRPLRKPASVEPARLSPEDSLLGTQFPVPEHLTVQRELVLQHSRRAKDVIVPDVEHLEGHFSSGVIELVLEEIDSEPMYFYGHLEEPHPQTPLGFIIYGIPSEQLDKLVYGQKYRVHWIETVVNTAPFDDDRYRDFLTYRIEGKRGK